MYFETFDSLVRMDGHGPYVWGCYLIALMTVGYNLVSPLRARRRVMNTVRRRIRREDMA